MGIFSGEKYSKEGYEEAREDAESADKHAEKFRGVFYIDKRDPFKFVEVPTGARARKSAKERLEKLFASGQKEALVLNEEYDRLLVRVQEAVKAVADFEREKLGMHKEGAEGTDTDK